MMERRCQKKQIWERKLPCWDKTCGKDHCVTSSWQSLPTVSKETRTSVHSHQKLIRTTIIQVCKGTPRPRKEYHLDNTSFTACESPSRGHSSDVPLTLRNCEMMYRRTCFTEGEASCSSLTEIWTVRALLRRLAMHTESGSSLSGDTGKDLIVRGGWTGFSSNSLTCLTKMMPQSTNFPMKDTQNTKSS